MLRNVVGIPIKANDVMRVAYVCGGLMVPSAIFRRPFFESLKTRGHDTTFFPSIPSRYDSWRVPGWRGSHFLKQKVRSWQFNRIRRGNFDSVVLETGIFHSEDGSYEEHLRSVSKRLVYEIDDAVFLLFPDKIARIASIADHVIAGNEAIANWIAPHNPSISIIPTCVDERDYPSKWSQPTKQVTSAESSVIVIGWIGSAGNVDMLAPLLPMLDKLSQRQPLQIRIVTAKSRHGSLSTDNSDLVRWIDIDKCDQMREVRQFDIGLMPLPLDDEWAQYKCNAKMIQYMASGLPTVASDWGFNRTLIDQSVNGLLVESEADWIAAIEQLASSPSQRRSMGEAARETVLDGFTVQSQIENYEKAVF